MEAGKFKLGGIAQEVELIDTGDASIEQLTNTEQKLDDIIIEDKLPIEPPVVKDVIAPIEPPIIVKQDPPVTVSEQIELDEELQKIYNFKKETGGNIDDYIASQKNWDEVSDIDIIKNQIRNENKKIKLTDEQLTLLASKKLGFDLSEGEENYYEGDKLTLQIEASKQREAYKELQQKINTPKENQTKPISTEAGQAVADTVTLTNGEVVDRVEYSKARAKYESTINAEIEKFIPPSISIEIGVGDAKKTLSFDYIIEAEDKHRMLSYLKNVPSEVVMQHVGENGELDIVKLTNYAFQQDPVIANRFVNKMTTQAFSRGQESVLKQETNVNFDLKTPEKKGNPYKAVFDSREDIVTTKFSGFN